ncbi:hypothetical protein [Burkholderia guangdongensis]|uniref:hypothetical protein n=1 Tax=Burkholderia guangdongensis TaxID=1792500 RepID=UPI0015C8B935|nr:hypothetical protein [Burkholderia guangdongensis]
MKKISINGFAAAVLRSAGVAVFGIAVALPGVAAQPADATSGQALYADVLHFEQFGIHRFGSAGQNAALDWIADRLKSDGFTVEEQRFSVDRQYFLDDASLKVGGTTLTVMPQWWLPERAARFSLSAPIVREGDAAGKFVRVTIPYDRGAYLGARQRDAVAQAVQRHPAAVLLTIDHPSGEVFAYNVAQTDTPWPVPVILVAPKDVPMLEAAEKTGEPVTLSVNGHYEHNVPGRNIIGRLDRGKARTVVVSTPESSWFESTCERGPGIAAFLATASVAAQSLKDVNLVFVATSGHEVGHGGMEYFIRDKAPKPQDVAVWLHYGASLACYAQPADASRSSGARPINSDSRFLLMTDDVARYVEPAFKDVAAQHVTGPRASVGELRDIIGAGYSHVFGMAGLHPLFHTPFDNARMTSPDLPEPVVRAFVASLEDIVDSQRDGRKQ